MKIFKEQVIPLLLTVVAFLGLTAILYTAIYLLNLFPIKEKIIPQIRISDILVGLTIYLKTSIDFGIFIGNLMRKNPGWKKRVSIEFGTAAGNAFGTLFVLFIWYFLKEAPILLMIMIILASMVLLRMAEESLEEFLHKGSFIRFHSSISLLNEQIRTINNFTKPVLGKIMPSMSMTGVKEMSFISLLFFSFTIPFILGLDDFAGYVPLFSVINVFSFSIGVFLGHMILNIGLFTAPKKTTELVENSIVLLIGGAAFVVIAFWGFYEVAKIGLELLGH